ncbi:uncharacterized protein [Oryza sativa Japonica Group]|jgi:hypothetical protein|uniref:Os02g0820600 protein n=2 Tax=Oryza sativa subsp. japonica TaxID=39947 RepID=A3ACS0_ORYSJ|nr:uncharacterized protein LOC4331171 [Oryza sativa Japonica Group]KAB8089547.1 hypothetical protein EE612_014515 [Oryza sativa]EAZ25109.1 hypothetical protein OsJ_08904 [Oryza sativa Japonica Group]KAF2947680.1 hypothetical protein DAI22_02g386700 [Oryza sativa Japonica Group]BAD23107.1 unknown protein [Oryza sativa Japonica Group]BAF10458.1 Os02g0820600 [Oryza sativa Japonica Group]|eukprot:NP_001048544.1 Os02g0820600 [Oryza sativa Japonica Group]
MASDDLFEGLPPPAAAAAPAAGGERAPSPSPPPPPRLPALKSALKRDKLSSSDAAASSPAAAAATDAAAEGRAPEKRLRFRTTVDASETQVIDAMHKITSHIRNPSKFSKASKLALQLIEAGSVKPGTISHFFAILEAAMSSPGACNEPSVRADYQALFNAAQGVTECFNQQQKNQFDIWVLHAVVANDLFTDDSFVFSKAVGKIKDAISALPITTVDDDNDEAAALAAVESNNTDDNPQAAASNSLPDDSTHAAASNSSEESSDPFGLDGLLEHKSKKSEKAREKTVAALNRKADEDESKRFLKSQREALLKCLEIAARRYRIPWTQTAIDIFAKHAYDNMNRFTTQQRDAITKLWNSIKEQQIRRKQGKSVSGKLDVNAFEYLQEKYSHEKISIRHAVGGGGERRATQWLG